MDNNGEPAANNNSSVPAAEKWIQTFSGLQTFAVRAMLFSQSIFLLGLVVAEHHHPSPSCLAGSDKTDEMLAKGLLSMYLLTLAAVVLIKKQRIRGLSALQLARLRSKLNYGYFLCTIVVVAGVTLTGLAMMDGAQIVFGLWRCRAPSTIAFMVLPGFFTVLADGRLLVSIYIVIST
ncbi:hypothetical protein MKW98_017333 [Papaver atlanticum]|uniref:Uncharacterized protein n=1 Tax=Papaver atlanticum TaxID=357466 RepID=A0AAD4SQQ7_9MAGN|nr:hypothetical protein MKW98_017333 [Papaver atlanticum]